MRSIDEFKMVLHNTAIVINNCGPNDFPTLLRRFSIYDPVCHRVDPLGIFYDKDTRKLYLPRGIDVDFVRRKVESSMEVEEFTSTVVHNDKYCYVTKPIKMKMLPRDDAQQEALRFVLCKDKYQHNAGKSQFYIM